MIGRLLDMGLPRGTAVDLRALGWDAIHAGECGFARDSDENVLDVARRDGRVVVTLDRDFARLLAVGSKDSPSLIHVRIGRLNRAQASPLLLEVLPRFEAQLRRGAIVTVSRSSVRVRHLPISSSGG